MKLQTENFFGILISTRLYETKKEQNFQFNAKYMNVTLTYKFGVNSVGNHFLKLLANLASNYWNLLAKIKFH
jgi:protein involved in ribonucleotide reduction